ncbi:putative calpain-like cysteine peptidase [Leishmania infantum JPCM5]|nr:putative calpain-like cysteine peptidase [Leishmania infantum JPCM5]CAM69030.1 putative calpain-like cysteine peptidase [Leishmania infantum JPCM5]|eukprot:XP_001466318.1 putative calpain-like cysteine peptidase [Leishmania infantum JPCM5]
MAASSIHETPDSGEVFADHEFNKNNAGITDDWISIRQLYPAGVNQPLLPEVFSREQFGQGNHYECFMLSALATLIRFPDVIRNCFVTKKVRQDGRYTFQFFRGQEWVKVEIDDRIAMEEGEVLYARSPTEHWWPLLLEKAYAKFYTAYDHLEGCTLLETFHDLTGNPVLNIPMDAKLAKAANCNVLEGRYWLDLAQRIQSGEFVASALTKDVEVETMGLQREQQYGILDIFSLHGTSSLDDILVHMHNPFEDDEFLYSGPLNPNDSAWSEKQRVKYDVGNPRSIFLPLNVFLRIVNSMQLCYISTVASDATYFEDEWKGESAGGNPTYVTWRKNPLYYISNHGTEAVTLSFVVKQEDQRHRKGPEETATYKQCGMILSQYSYLYPIPTFWVTGNNHKPIHKSLFLNSREVASSVIVPPQSLCYLVPSCMHQGEEARFLLSAHRMVHEDYSNITIKKLTVPEMDWENPAAGTVQLQMRTKDRLDFYVDEPTDVHILLHQTKPYVSPKTGGDAMAQDYMGMYLYDDTDRKIAGVHAATNFRETSIIHRLPRSGRYAISITCPRGKGHITANVTIVSSFGSHIRRVNAPEDAAMLPDEAESVADSEGVDTRVARIDYNPFQEQPVDVREHPDSNVPFEDRGFMLSNRDVTSEPWLHIGDLYPEGKTRPLLPNVLSRDQFGQGAMHECCCLTGFATLIENHPDVIRNCFISKNPRKDGRYTFQFHRYGQWIKVEIDDRIPMVKGDTVFCRSPTHHWWPLLLEKAYAKFYTLYENLAGCSLAEVYHDFSGCPVINTPLDEVTAKSVGFDIASPVYWVRLRDELRMTAVAALSGDNAESLGLAPHQFYGILNILATSSPPRTLSEVIVQLHNPYAEISYTGPMSDPADPRWASREMRHCNATQNTIFVPVNVFLRSFFTISQAHLRGLMEPCWNFHSEWGDGTNGGNPSLLTWRENPLYIVRNTGSEAVEVMGMIRQPDKRHQLHVLPELSYVRCDLLLAQSIETDSIPTYLVTHNNHDVVHKRVFLNYREVASKIRVPPQSQCYLVPTAMYHEKSIFLLSYWYRTPADEGAVSIERLRVNVARDLPAVKHVTLVPEGKDRVDFFVDVPTDAHILLSQWNRDARGGSNVRTDNYVGMYLYDDANQKMAQVSAASNLKEIGLVAHLPAQGHYVLSITCPAARDEEVKCRVEIVCVEMARVRITDVYENPPSSEELEGEPPVALVDSDTARSDVGDGTQSVEATVETRPPANTEAKEREKTPSLSFMRPRYQGIWTEDLLLMETPAFAKMAGEREQLKKHASQHAARMNSLENKMEDMATRLADDMHDQERAFLGPELEGVPLELLPLNEDEEFTGLEHELRVAMRDLQKNRGDVVALRETLKERAGEMAKKLKENERDLFLNPMPLGISCDGLPLDSDPEFHALEVARLRERQEESCDEAKIRKLNDALNERAEGLARAKLAADRQYLKPEHLRVAVDELPLNDDRNFILKEALRHEKLKNSRESAAAIAALGNELNNMAKGMAAEMLAKQRPSYLAREHHGRRMEDLLLNDNDDFLKKERRRRDLLKQPSSDMDVVAEIEKELNGMADEMARAMNAAERPQYMKASYYDKTLSELPLDTDPIIARLEAQRARLKRDPVRNAEAVHATEAAIISRAEALAKAMIKDERARLYGKPSGVPVNLLDLDEDQVIRRLEEERMELLKMPNTDPHAIASNEEKLKARAAKIAEDFRDNMRAQITGEGRRSPSVMSIGSDAPCQDLEEKLYALMSEDPIANEDQINDIKDAIRKRNAELKRQAVQALRAFLDDKPFGILLTEVGLDDDREYMEREEKLKKGQASNLPAAQITFIQEGMQHRVNELAAEELARRYPFIHTRPASIPLPALPSVGRDQAFWKAIDNVDKAKNHHNTATSQLRAYEKSVNERLHQIAEAAKWKERDGFLDSRPAHVPVKAIPLDNDTDFVDLESKRRLSLQSGADPQSDDIRTLEKALRTRAHDLACDKKWADRDRVLDPKPEGVPLRCVPLDEDAEFVALEDEWRGLLQDPQRNSMPLKDLERRMNDRAHDLACDKKWADRDRVLDPKPEGVPLRCVPLDEDAEFVALEDEWRGLLQDPQRNSMPLKDLERRMNDRAHDLACDKKWADRDRVLDPKPEGVPLRCVPLDEDAEFVALEDEWRGLLQDPQRNSMPLKDLERRMNDRAHDLACDKKWADRDRVLDPKPEGVPLRCVPLDEDAEFVALEDEWRGLLQDPQRNSMPLKDLERRMNDRAHDLACDKKWAGRDRVLDPKPEGVPLRCVPLDEDAEFVALEDEWRGLLQDPQRSSMPLKDLERRMNDRAHDLACDKKWADRDRVLDPKPEGVPLRCVPLDEDAEFLALEDEWRGLLQDPQRNSMPLKDLERRMNDRAHDLACDKKWADRDRVLDPKPEGVPLRCVPLDEDAEFLALEDEWRGLLQDPQRNSMPLKDLERRMNDRAHDLACDKKWADRDRVLDPKPEGVPLRCVPLDEDAEFLALEDEWRGLLQDPQRNSMPLKDLERRMNDRAHDLACDKKWAGRDRVLDPKPEGVPLRCVPLDEDAEFVALEDEWRGLLQDPQRSSMPLKDLERRMNDRAHDLACDKKWADRDRVLDPKPEGVPLRCVPLDEDAEFVALEDEWRGLLQDPQRNSMLLKDLERRMNDRAHDLACDKKWAGRDRVLDPKPEGVPLRCVPLDEDAEFVALEDEWRGLLQDPQRSSMPLKDLERRMNDRAHDLACDKKWADRDRVLDPKPEGVPLRCVPLDEDAEFLALEDEWRGLLQDPQRNSMPLKDLERRMNDRAHDLACDKKWADRDRVLDPKPEGVPLRCVPLDEDAEFLALEDEWRGLLQDPQRNSMPLKDLERRMNDRAHDLACDKKWAGRDRVLDPKPEGVPLRCVPLDEDAEFVALEDEWRGLLQDPQRSSMPLKDLERRMNDRAHDLACDKKWAGRDRVLDPKPEGVPLRCVPLDEDAEFVALEDEWRGLLQDPQRSSMPLKDLERRMNDRAHDLACDKKWAGRDRVLDPKPEGVPLRCVPLDEDAEFLALEDEWRGLLQDPQRNSMPLKDLERRMNDRAHDLACDKKWAGRDRVLDPKPEGVPLRCVPLDEDAEFVALEDEWRGLLQDPQRNSMPLKDLERRMNDRAHDLACDKKWADRDRVLDPKPEGVPLRCVPLDEDAEFVALEDEWRGLLQDPQRSSMPLKDLERRMNDRAHDLACDKKWADRDRVLDPKPEGVPLRCVPLDEDAEFVALEDEWRGLLQDPQRNSMPLKDLERRMNDRAHDLACDKKWADRDRVLDPKPEGVPLRCVPLDEDAEFVALEDEWRGLLQDPQRNSMPLKDLERRMNDRAHDLACDKKWADRDRVLDPKPEGVPLRCVPLDEDAEFVALEDEWRGLLQDPQRSSMPLKDLERRMNDRAHDLACDKKWADRDRVLDPKPEGVPLRCVPLDEDAEFVALEDEWRGLLQDPQRNSMPLKDLERRMNDRAHDLACDKKWADRDRVLDPKPEGVPLRCVPLDEDAEFVALEDEWRGLLQDPQRNSMPLKDLERRMNDRAHDLACDKKWADRDRVLDPKPEGVPLRCVPLDEDAEFLALEDEWRGLLQDPQRNSMPLKDLERRMNDRAHDLACDKKWADRDRVLDPKPEGVPLRCVPLDEDAEFLALEDEWRGLLQDPQRNSMPLKDLERRMNDRAHDLACDKKWADRDRVLDPKPEGVPLRCVPLDEDAEFLALEDEWRGLLQDPQRNSMPLKDLERRMNDRAHDLACDKKWADRDRVLDPKPEGVPLRCVPLDEDAEFLALEDEWRGLLQDPQRNSMPLKDLERRMNDRAHDLACDKKWAGRDRVLDPKPEGVPLRCVPLDEDAEFVALEDEWRGLLQDPQRSSMPLKDLERRMNDRAHDLACDKKWAGRDRVLDPKPEGVPLRCVPLDEDAEFVALEDEWRGLLQDPQRSSMPLKDLERRMNDRAHDLACDKKWADRDRVLDPKPEGVPLRCVPLDEDAEFVALEDEWRGLLQDPQRSSMPLKDLERRMNDRAHDLACDKKWADRDRVLDPKPEGVPLRCVPLDEDAEFVALEDEWRGLLQDPQRNSMPLKDLERRMNDRAHDLACDKKWADRDRVLDPKPEGVPLRCVPLDEDAEFVALEDEWRGLLQDPQRSSMPLKDLERRMNDRAHDLACDKKWAGRDRVLDPKPEGVPLRCVPLDEDAEFLALEDEWRGLLQDPQRSSMPLKDLERRMNDRAHDLACDKKWADRDRVLDPKPEGVPLRCVPLDEDAEFVALEDEWRGLLQDPQRNSMPLKDLERRMNDRAHDLACDKKWADRDRVLDPKPEGVPLRCVPLDEDAEFVALEDEWRGLLQDPQRSSMPLKDLERRMNDRAHDLACDKKWADRDRVLDPKPEGVPLRCVPLDEDAEFVALEDEWRGLLQDPQRNSMPLKDLERRMNDRAHDLACDKKWADRDRVLDPKPEGVPLRCVPLDEDAEFLALEDEWRGLLQDPQRSSMPLKDLERRMNDRAHDLACDKKWADRDRVLDPKPEGVPLRCVPLDEDAEFVALEDEWRGLLQDPQRSSMPLKDLERRMNDRAHDVACGKKWADRDRVLDPKPEGVPLRCVPLDEDAEFVALEDEWRGLLQDPQRSSMPLKDLERRMNDRAHDLACDKKWADRDRVLDPKPEGVPLRCVPLDEDAEFVALEDEWRGLLQDPQRSSMPLKDLERRMNDRAHDLACDKKWADRDRVLDPKPEGVPLRCVPLDEDAEFVALEDEWRGLLQDPQRSSMPLKDLERRMNDRAHDLACDKKWAGRDRVLDPKPEGVPLRCVPLDEDAEFVALEDEWRGLLQDPQRSSMPLKDLERRMNDRAHDVACGKKWADRDRVLDPKPEGVPLRCVPLDEDAEFVALEDEWRGLLQDPQRNSMPLKDLERRMNDRAHDLACGKKWADRDRVLDPKPEGVPLHCVPLDEDAEFVALEDEWRGLLQDPQRNAKRIAVLEEDMTARALLVGQIVNRRNEDGDVEEYEDYVKRGASEFCDVDDRNTDDATVAMSVGNGRLSMKEGFKELLGTEVDGVPVLLLNLDEDSLFSERNREYMNSEKLGLDRSRICWLEEKMIDRAYALARRFKDEARKVIVGVQMSQMAEGGAELDSDEIFLAFERELHNLEACDPRGKSGRRAALEESMRHRASELARPVLHFDNGGIPVDMLNEQSNGELFPKRPDGGRQRRSSKDIGHRELGTNKRRCHIADEAVADDPSLLFGREIRGVPVDRIPLREDEVFRGLAEEKRRVTSHPEDYSSGYKEEVEDAMRRRVEELADEYKRDHVERTAARDERPKMPAKPNGVSKESGGAARRPRAKKKLKEVEERTEEHRLETVEEAAPFTDPPFHSANKQVADSWPRIADVYPEGLTQPLLPDHPKASDMASSAGDLTYLAPFLAALSRQPPLLHRLFQTKMHPVRAPYRFVFFDPNSAPVTVEIDDRIPCDVNGVPRFTVSPSGAWWPLLVERAYAKYVGGYERFDQCTSHETLRDLTGRPVTHLPLDAKLSAEVVGCNYRDVAFWRRIHEQLERGDVFVAVSGDLVPDGIHPRCYYAVFDVIETVPGSNDPSDVVVKIHNCYHDAPQYHGPLAMGDSDWTPILRSVCKANPESEPEFLYLPQPVFLRNFSSMQRCHINCGDRLTVSGEWADNCSGGSPTYTTFRQNPMYLLQNNSNHNVTVLAELRHSAPVYYDAHNMGVYHLTALALLRPDRNAQLVAPLLAHNTHKFVQKGLLTDAREVCAEMELPANSTCYLIPYTKKKACFGKYQLSVYPQDNPVNLTTLRPIAETHNCMAKDVVVQPGSGTSARVDIMVSEPCDVHALLHQNKVTDPTAMRRGDHLAEDEIFMAAYENNALLVCSTGDASNAREHSVAFQAAKAGRYTFLIGCPSRPVSGDAPCTLIIYTPKFAQASFASVNGSTRSRVPPRVQPVNAATTSASARLGSWQSQAPQSYAPVSNGAVHTPRGNPRSREYLQ